MGSGPRPSAELPPCYVCGERPVHNKAATTCHRRACMAEIERERKLANMDYPTPAVASYYRLDLEASRKADADKQLRRARTNVNRLVAMGADHVQAISMTAARLRMTNAEVFQACRSRTPSA